MDFISAFKSELFRPLATLVVPGGVALGPYVLVAGYYFPDVISFWREHPSAFVAIVVISIVAVGLIVEDLGAFIERDFWDSKLAKENEDHLSKCNCYVPNPNFNYRSGGTVIPGPGRQEPKWSGGQ